jgi:hypothetical protein
LIGKRLAKDGDRPGAHAGEFEQLVDAVFRVLRQASDAHAREGSGGGGSDAGQFVRHGMAALLPFDDEPREPGTVRHEENAASPKVSGADRPSLGRLKLGLGAELVEPVVGETRGR